jgi:hypothetical protein
MEYANMPAQMIMVNPKVKNFFLRTKYNNIGTTKTMTIFFAKTPKKIVAKRI